MESLFENWKPRASSFGYLLTNLPEKFTSESEKKLQDLLDEKLTGKNANGNTTKWSDNKQAEVDKLLLKKKGIDTLPDGAITKLEEIFDAIFWKRKKNIDNDYVKKGIANEQDSFSILSEIDGTFYGSNTEFIQNEYACGTPDNVINKVIDLKTSYDYFTFKKSKLSDLYKWQIKTYTWILISNGEKIDRTGELCYCLTNTPPFLIESKRKSIYFSKGLPELIENEDNSAYYDYIKEISQLEQNHICDIEDFVNKYEGVMLNNKVFRDIPKHMRVKRFDVTLEDEDIEHMERRSIMCKEWLIEREQKEIEIINSVKF